MDNTVDNFGKALKSFLGLEDAGATKATGNPLTDLASVIKNKVVSTGTESPYVKSSTGRYLDQEGVDIEMSTKYPSAGGYVSSDTPDKVYLNPDNPTSTSTEEIFVHEYQHLLDNTRSNGIQSLLENKAPTGASYKNTSEDFEKLFKNIDSTYKKYKNKYNLSNDFTESGMFAELKRIESSLPVGKNIFDTDIGKDISKGLPYFKAGYFNQTRPKTGEIMYSLETALGEPKNVTKAKK